MACVLDPERVFIVSGGMLNPWIWWSKFRNAVVVVVVVVVGDKIQPHLHVVSPGGRSCAAALRSHGRANEALVF